MRSIQKLSTATPHTIRHELLQAVEHLLLSIRRDSEVLAELHQVSELLDSVLLASDEYQTATNRVRNAHRYLISKERGAARYELQLLAGILRPREIRSVTPHFRLRQQPVA